jgi:hypothetical protein
LTIIIHVYKYTKQNNKQSLFFVSAICYYGVLVAAAKTTHDDTTTFNNKTEHDDDKTDDMATNGHNIIPNELEREARRPADLFPARAQMRADRKRNPNGNEGTTIDSYNHQTTTDQQSTNTTDRRAT